MYDEVYDLLSFLLFPVYLVIMSLAHMKKKNTRKTCLLATAEILFLAIVAEFTCHFCFKSSINLSINLI